MQKLKTNLSHQPRIVFDFDGTITSTEFQDFHSQVIPHPDPQIVDFIRRAHAAGVYIIISSGRWSEHPLATPEQAEENLKIALEYLDYFGIPYDEIWKKPIADLYVDNNVRDMFCDARDFDLMERKLREMEATIADGSPVKASLDSRGLDLFASLESKGFDIVTRYGKGENAFPDLRDICPGHCEGMGVIPVYLRKGDTKIKEAVCNDSKNPVLIKLWEEAEAKSPCEDGWHFVECPECNGTGRGIKSSLIDYPRQDLPPLIWDKDEEGDYVLRPEVKEKLLQSCSDAIRKHYRDPDSWVLAIVMGSSIATQFYNSTTDIDVKFVVDIKKFKEANPEFQDIHSQELIKEIAKVVKKEEQEYFVDGHPIEFFAVSRESLRSEQFLSQFDTLYDVTHDLWIKEPKLVNPDSWSRQSVVRPGWEMALDWAEQWDVMFGEMKRIVSEINLLLELFKAEPETRGERQGYMDKLLKSLTARIKRVVREKDQVRNLRRRADFSPTPGYKGFANARPQVIQLKLLFSWGYINTIKELKKAWNKQEVLTESDIPLVEKALCVKKVAVDAGLNAKKIGNLTLPDPPPGMTRENEEEVEVTNLVGDCPSELKVVWWPVSGTFNVLSSGGTDNPLLTFIGSVNPKAKKAVLEIVEVKKNQRGKGHGRKLVSWFVDFSRRMGATDIGGEQVPGSEGFWEHLNWKKGGLNEWGMFNLKAFYPPKRTVEGAAWERTTLGCVMAVFPGDLSKAIKIWAKQNIPEEDVYFGGEGELHFGYGENPHATILFGFEKGESPETVFESLEKSLDGYYRCKLGKISKFRDASPDWDALKIEIESLDLTRAHAILKGDFPGAKESFAEYLPHCTLAYVKKGRGEDLVGDTTFDGIKLDIDTVEYTYFPEGGEKERSEFMEITDEPIKASLFGESSFDRLYKEAVAYLEGDPHWQSYLVDPYLAQQYGEFQEAVRQSRSEKDLRDAWEKFRPILAWDDLVRRIVTTPYAKAEGFPAR